MPHPTRDRVTVDLRGVGERLRSQAAARRMTTGAFVRRAVLLQLEDTALASAEPMPSMPSAGEPLVKVTLRMSAAHVVALATRARRADISQGAYVAALLEGHPPPPVPSDRKEAIAALVASTDQLAALGTDIRALTRFLSQSHIAAATRYRQRLDDVFIEVREHLLLAGQMLGSTPPVQRSRVIGRPSPRRAR